MYPHRIRLRGPWDCQPVAPDGPARRITPPARLRDAGLAGFAGRVRLTRRFGYPGRIDSYEHVWLTFAEVTGRAQVMLNGVRLGADRFGTFEFDVTDRLADRNALEIVLDAEDDEAGLAGEVAMEIRRDAFLRDVRAAEQPDSTLRVTGQVVGRAEPLELYVLADGKALFYSPISAHPDGHPFDVASPEAATSRQVRVELVHVAERWYEVAVPVERYETP
jgi:hypothetical protein